MAVVLFPLRSDLPAFMLNDMLICPAWFHHHNATVGDKKERRRSREKIVSISAIAVRLVVPITAEWTYKWQGITMTTTGREAGRQAIHAGLDLHALSSSLQQPAAVKGIMEEEEKEEETSNPFVHALLVLNIRTFVYSPPDIEVDRPAARTAHVGWVNVTSQGKEISGLWRLA